MEQEIPHHQYPNYRLLSIVSSKTNPNYIEIKKLLEDKIIKEKLDSLNIKIGENIIDDPNKFIMSLYNEGMSVILSLQNGSKESLDKIIDYVDKTIQQKVSNTPIKQSGGRIDYKQKYLKYKQKYNKMSKVITSFSKFYENQLEY